MDQLDDEEGLPEKLVIKNQQFHKYVVQMDWLMYFHGGGGVCVYMCGVGSWTQDHNLFDYTSIS